MPTYTWTGINIAGKKIKGENFALSKMLLTNNLAKQDIVLTKITQKFSWKFWQRQKITKQQCHAVIQQLATLLTANVSLYQALNIIKQNKSTNALNILLTQWQKAINDGRSLAYAFRMYPHYFNELTCNLVDIGEQSGTLDLMLTELAQYIEKTTQQKRKVLKALLYPTTVIIIATIVTAVLLIFVIPHFQVMFASLGAQLPSYTRFIIALSHALRKFGWALVIAIFAAIIVYQLILRNNTNFCHWREKLFLRLPIIGTILTHAIIVRLTKTLGLTFKAGIPLLKALKISATTASNWQYEQALLLAANQVANGQSLARALQEQLLFPEQVIQLVALGEESGTLDKMLEKIAAIYSDGLNYLTENLNTLLEPCIMLVLGVIVGGLIIGMYLPIFKLGSQL